MSDENRRESIYGGDINKGVLFDYAGLIKNYRRKY